MTWDNLADRIAQMNPEERKQDVRFIEPYDHPDIWEIHDVERATEDVESEHDDEVVVYKGEPFLG